MHMPRSRTVPPWLRPLLESRPGKFLTAIVRRYFVHDVGRQAAALAYYLLFTIFPFLIFVSSLLGLLRLDVDGILRSLSALLPAGVLDLVGAYLTYVSQTSSRAMLWFSLVFTIYFPMRASDCLMQAVRRAYHLPRPRNPIVYWFKVLLYTVFLLVAIAVTLFLTTVGERMLLSLSGVLHLPAGFARLWGSLRFAVAGAVMFAAIGILYAAAQDARQSARNVIPGALTALAGWLVASGAYAFYVENFANYSLIYGALGTIIVLMVWLNLTAVVLIMGSEVNGALLSLRRDRESNRERRTGRNPPDE